MDPLHMDMTWRRNAPDAQGYTLTDADPDTGTVEPIDLTGYSFRMQLRLYPGAPNAEVTLGMAGQGQPGFFLDDAPGGAFTLTPPSSAQLLALPYAGEIGGDQSILAYDWLLIHPDGIAETFALGSVLLPSGVTRL